MVVVIQGLVTQRQLRPHTVQTLISVSSPSSSFSSVLVWPLPWCPATLLPRHHPGHGLPLVLPQGGYQARVLQRHGQGQVMVASLNMALPNGVKELIEVMSFSRRQLKWGCIQKE